MIYQILAEPRGRYEVPLPFVEELGTVRFPGPDEVRRLEYLLRRQAGGQAAARRTAGGLVALGVLNEVHRHLLGLYRRAGPGDPLGEAAGWLSVRLGAETLRGCFASYLDLFPPPSASAPLLGSRQPDLLGEILLLAVVNRNPACAAYRELHSDDALRRGKAYVSIVSGVEGWAGDGRPALGWDRGIIDLLMAPIRHAPDSLLAQLEYARERWGSLIGPLLRQLLLAIDVLREEQKPRWAGPPGGPTPLPRYPRPEEEAERYSADLGWMPRLVLMAKHALVWLHQLSERYGRPVVRLDEIPDEELDALAGAGFTGLWLIGIWARSPASQTIKRRCGNPEAAGSAYAIVEYAVAPELGGEEAALRLAARCAARGIRLGCDMVPNHTALDSRWVSEHPEWFVQTASLPFPSYAFASDPVGGDRGMEVRIEDHYYDRTDAAVVFQRRSLATGEARYLYHGNDGTATPWNDTAQLDFLRNDVREAVIGQILRVARAFSVIRFDAAMVLTRKHVQRLWYPPPGSGGDIPSRAERGLEVDEFDRRMPEEFWRQVVDRVAAEAPETLLLAEAFWLLEGYFVRTLGMHRVYNSAFMNMLKAEENASYRQLIKSTLEYDPEILKRYVNFMSNPDEEPAAVQFGRGDKYFGIAVMMTTLPGLPMFGHGQIEGYAEKYGMEYSRAYRGESPDPDTVDRHRREIYPLLRLRPLFAEAHSFRLFDLYGPDGQVNENVFAYTNRRDDAFALVIYNNRFEAAEGWLSTSAAFRDRSRGNALVRRSLGEEIGLSDDEACYCVFRDAMGGREYIRPSRRLLAEGLHIALPGYGCQVFLDFRERRDNRLGHCARLCADLGGAGVPSIPEALKGYLAPVRDALRALLEPVPAEGRDPQRRAALAEAIMASLGLSPPSMPHPPGPTAGRPEAPQARTRLARYLRLHPWLAVVRAAVEASREAEEILRHEGAGATRPVREELDLPGLLHDAAVAAGLPQDQADRAASLLTALAREGAAVPGIASLDPAKLLGDPVLRAFLGVNRFGGAEWIRKEPLEDLVRYLEMAGSPKAAGPRSAARLLAAAEKAGYRVDLFLSALPSGTAARRRPSRRR